MELFPLRKQPLMQCTIEQLKLFYADAVLEANLLRAELARVTAENKTLHQQVASLMEKEKSPESAK
jgi:hypothetical protein